MKCKIKLHFTQVFAFIISMINTLMIFPFQLDFWRSPKSVYHPTDIMVPFQSLAKFQDLLKEHNMTFSIMIDDVEALIQQQRNQMKGRKNVTTLADFVYSVYHPYEEVMCFFF